MSTWTWTWCILWSNTLKIANIALRNFLKLLAIVFLQLAIVLPLTYLIAKFLGLTEN